MVTYPFDTHYSKCRVIYKGPSKNILHQLCMGTASEAERGETAYTCLAGDRKWQASSHIVS